MCSSRLRSMFVFSLSFNRISSDAWMNENILNKTSLHICQECMERIPYCDYSQHFNLDWKVLASISSCRFLWLYIDVDEVLCILPTPKTLFAMCSLFSVRFVVTSSSTLSRGYVLSTLHSLVFHMCIYEFIPAKVKHSTILLEHRWMTHILPRKWFVV